MFFQFDQIKTFCLNEQWKQVNFINPIALRTAQTP